MLPCCYNEARHKKGGRKLKTFRTPGYTFQIACSEKEFALIHKLNYKTFALEIPQHEQNDTECLIDKFHKENTYIICMDDDKLAGMVAVRGNRPFSLDAKIPELDSYLPEGRKVCEIRLLAVEPDYRNSLVFWGIVKALSKYCRENGYEYAVVSGTTRQLKLYAHMGFKPFYHIVGKEGATYQPLYATIGMFDKSLEKLWNRTPERNAL